MQLVMAWFMPDSSAKVLEKLVQAVGAPSEQKSFKGTAPEDAQALWELPQANA